ncbi:DUF3320 domain-containing protein [Streptomyces sp. DSM 41972]|uniref:DUF3320 domain-containing protein n=1 Tax=Streptomyces althioticus subsp. attaecolombicae TaxID=3075534 RepID=A0ABU3HTN0_9ACTN|nr:DUF3320 domain-containing protein [Streptomyces sp. DSM 41972]
MREAVEQAVAQGPLGVSSAVPAERARERPGAEPEADGVTTEEAGTLPAVPAPRTQAHIEVEYERVPVDTGVERTWSTPYRTASVVVHARHELHTRGARPAVRKMLTEAIELEGPIHEDLLVQRVREAWGVQRAGHRIRDNVLEVARGLVRTGQVAREDSFYDVSGRKTLKARTPEAGGAVRKIMHIAPAERYVALYELAAECPGMSHEELIKQACEFFGWRRTGKDIRDCLAADIDVLHQRGRFGGGPEFVSAVRL